MRGERCMSKLTGLKGREMLLGKTRKHSAVRRVDVIQPKSEYSWKRSRDAGGGWCEGGGAGGASWLASLEKNAAYKLCTWGKQIGS